MPYVNRLHIYIAYVVYAGILYILMLAKLQIVFNHICEMYFYADI